MRASAKVNSKINPNAVHGAPPKPPAACLWENPLTRLRGGIFHRLQRFNGFEEVKTGRKPIEKRFNGFEGVKQASNKVRLGF